MNATARELTLETLSRILRDQGVVRLFFKPLSPNDNSKNQIYLGGELSVLNVLPSGDLISEESDSDKPGAEGKQRLKAPLSFFWIDTDGSVHAAPNAQLILYPQYPEVRFSGFLHGSTVRIGEWLAPAKRGRSEGRVLLLGVARDGRVYGHLVLPDSTLAKQLSQVSGIGTFGALAEVPFIEDDGSTALLRELERIHALGWIEGERLEAGGARLPCNSPNCGGYTLEAKLGITPNGFADPDFLGWEVKSFSVTNFARLGARVITLMTPEPDGGVYKDEGVEAFLRRFGYADANIADRINFGSVHAYARRSPRTGLRLTLTEFDQTSGKILNVNGGIALVNNGDCAALWTFKKLIDHWKRKHDKAAYVPNQAQPGPLRRYRYGSLVQLGRGTEFEMFLKAVIRGDVYYDPGIKLERASTTPTIKRRSQFRIKAENLGSLYRNFDQVPVSSK